MKIVQILGQPIVLCFAHRINNILKRCFYQTAQKQEMRIAMTLGSPSGKRNSIIQHSSSDDVSTDNDNDKPSPSKYVAANTSLSELSPKAKELLDLITTCKQVVKYFKLVRPVNSA